MFYTVGEMAKRMNVAPSTLRYYDKEGLLPFVERSESGIRLFRAEDMGWIEILECMKKTGMPLKKIKQFMDWCMEGDGTIENRLAMIDDQKCSVEQRIEEMKEHLHLLEFKKWYYETANQAGSCSVHDRMPLEQVPQEFHRYF